MDRACHPGTGGSFCLCTGEVQEGSGVWYLCFMAAALNIHIPVLNVLHGLELE